MMRSEPHAGLHYSDFLARLCQLREAEVYFEIGVQNGLNLSKIAVETAFGVDPDFRLGVDATTGKKNLHLHRVTSDAFFRSTDAKILRGYGIDLAFLDGMHVFEFLLRDFYNTEALCKPNSVITIHDCLPFDGEMIERVNNPAGRTPGPYYGAWTGDVWKIVPILQKYRPDLRIVPIDCYPTGLIAITNLNPDSSELSNKYLNIVEEFSNIDNDLSSLEAYYDSISVVPAASLLHEFDHSLYLKI